MKKIVVVDKNKNKWTFYKPSLEADLFVELNLIAWGLDEAEVEMTEMTKEQIEAYRYLQDSDWLIVRLNDPSSGVEVPIAILDGRTAARELL